MFYPNCTSTGVKREGGIFMKKAQVTQIDNATYRFTEKPMGEAVYMYLLVGSEKALLIDTGYGLTDVPSAIREITDLPVIVVNTHGHMDHIHGNHFYQEVYLAKEDEEVFSRHMDRACLIGLLKDILRESKMPLWIMKLPGLRGLVEKIVTACPSVHRPLPEEGYFELGNRRVKILHTPGHTVGSISLLDQKNCWLFSGDTTCCKGVLLHFPESTDVLTYKNSLQMLKELADEGKIRKLFPAHQKTPIEPKQLDLFLEACGLLLQSGEEKSGNRFLYKGFAIQYKNIKTGGRAK